LKELPKDVDRAYSEAPGKSDRPAPASP
jgi:hypothetical protein